MNTTHRSPFLRRTLGALAAVAAGACSGVPGPDLDTTTQALGGFEGTFEYAIDAPWRVEPSAAGYGAIPIQISIHDVMFDAMDRRRFLGFTGPMTEQIDEEFGLDQFARVEVIELLPDGSAATRTYQLGDLAEVEATRGCWVPSHLTLADQATGRATCSAAPDHRICRDPSSCGSWFEQLAGTSEWHAQLWYTPSPGAAVAGRVVPLQVRLYVDGTDTAGQPRQFVLTNYLRVRLGDAALPTFGDDWLYGDLHYHSQGTDNEGESAYNYRGVVRAMGAMGLDFAFVTDHASDSEQVIDADVSIDIEPDLHDVDTLLGGVARDMTRARFDFSHALIHGAGGVNAEAARQGFAGPTQLARSRGVVPRLFLGGELDTIPEIDTHQPYPYGDGYLYTYGTLCAGWHDDLWLDSCDIDDLFVPAAGGGYLLYDTQGFNELHPGREHLIYLPRTAASTIGGESAFISSRTGIYGGAGRRLDHSQTTEENEIVAPLLPEVERKGYAFVAHPLNDGGSEGPNGPPWGDYMLRKVWRSPAILGLQLWNEDARLVSKAEDGDVVEHGFEHADPGGYDAPGDFFREGFETGSFSLRAFDPATGEWGKAVFDDLKLDGGLYVLDRVNLWGLDPAQTAPLGWVPRGEPRRMFLAGGSDAHGDLNYHRNGYFTGTATVTDSGLGKPRNLVYAGPAAETGADGRVYSQDQIVAGLAAGRFAVTDGPALRVVVDRNGNGAFDDPETDAGLPDRWGEPVRADIQMGGVAHVYSSSETIPLLIQWSSTAEFGRVERIEYTLGVRCALGETLVGTQTVPITAAYAGTVLVEVKQAPCGDGEDGSMMPDSAVESMFVRVSAYTERDADQPSCRHEDDPAARLGRCTVRRAHSNPIWIMRQYPEVGECPLDNRALDRDGDLVPDGCETDDIVGAAYFPTWARVYSWRWDGTIHVGTTTDLDAYGNMTTPLHLPAGKGLADVVAVAFCGKELGLGLRLFAWYRDGTVSQGWAADFEALQTPRMFSSPLPAKEIVSITCAEAGTGDGRVYTRYRDGTYSVGRPQALDLYQTRQPAALPAGKQPDDIVAQLYTTATFPLTYFRGGSTSGAVQINTSRFGMSTYTYPYLGTQQGQLGIPGL